MSISDDTSFANGTGRPARGLVTPVQSRVKGSVRLTMAGSWCSTVLRRWLEAQLAALEGVRSAKADP